MIVTTCTGRSSKIDWYNQHTYICLLGTLTTLWYRNYLGSYLKLKCSGMKIT